MASRKEEKQRLRQEREARERAEAAAAARRKRLGLLAAAGLAVAALIAAVVVVNPFGGEGGGGEAQGNVYPGGGKVPPARETDLRAAAEAAGCRLRSDKDRGSNHVETPVNYPQSPPTTGDHDAEPAGDGVSEKPVPMRNALHALEHGRIVYQFPPNAPAAVRANLKALYDEDPVKIILTPNDEGLKEPVAATAWTKALVCPRVTPGVYDAIRAFKDRYRDRGPEFVP